MQAGSARKGSSPPATCACTQPRGVKCRQPQRRSSPEIDLGLQVHPHQVLQRQAEAEQPALLPAQHGAAGRSDRQARQAGGCQGQGKAGGRTLGTARVSLPWATY